MPSSSLSMTALCRTLGLSEETPLTRADMAASLCVSFYPHTALSPRLTSFLARLKDALHEAGVTVIPYEQALARGTRGNVGSGIVLLAPGLGLEGNLAIDHVSSLSHNVVVGILDEPFPASPNGSRQALLDHVIATLVWHMVHVVIFVEDTAWTICTMNGAIIRCPAAASFTSAVRSFVVPKLAAPVVPPHARDFIVRESALAVQTDAYAPFITDMRESGQVWESAGLLMYQTPISQLHFRNKRYQRIATAYLNHRTGMSYGFLAHQLPSAGERALALAEAEQLLGPQAWDEHDVFAIDGRFYLAISLNTQRLIIPVPDVWVLCTRSGCNKSHIDPATDIVRLGLSNGQVLFEIPPQNGSTDCNPSFDTRVILAHALGNSVIASVLRATQPQASFLAQYQTTGVALAHWHGFLSPESIPTDYTVYGADNPPVSCSTAQSAVYALSGKISAFLDTVTKGKDYVGDVHIEPAHGTNITGPSLTALAKYAARGHTDEPI